MAEESFLTEFCSAIRNGAGSEISSKILEGFDVQDESDTDRLADWIAGVVSRLDNETPPDIRSRIMRGMGYGCAVMHNAHTEAKQKRGKFGSLDEYIAHEEENPYPGYSVTREGDRLLVTYNPSEMQVRCYCGPFGHLPPEKKVSLTYCECSAGHVECIWRHVTGKPVSVDVLCSCIDGEDACKFVVNLNPK